MRLQCSIDVSNKVKVFLKLFSLSKGHVIWVILCNLLGVI